MYNNLNASVVGKHVFVLGANADIPEFLEYSPSASAVVRFNVDSKPADIWATTFHDVRTPMVPESSRLVVATVPDYCITYLNPYLSDRKYPQDFRINHSRYRQSIPLETVKLAHWLQLAASMPIFPLSGITFLSMLQYVSFEKCYICGFNFYSNNTNRQFLAYSKQSITPGWPYFAMHDYILAISYLDRLVATDDRFVWCGVLSLPEMHEYWSRRLRQVYLSYRLRKIYIAMYDRMRSSLSRIGWFV